MLLAFVTTILDKCNSPLELAPPLNSSYRPVFVQIIARHGARAPSLKQLPYERRGAWYCDSESAPSGRVDAVPKNAPRRIHRVLDPRLARYPPNCSPGDLTVDGMSHLKRVGELYSKYLKEDLGVLSEYIVPEHLFLRSSYYERAYRSLTSFVEGLYPTQDYAELLTVVVGSERQEILISDPDACPDQAEIAYGWADRPEVAEWVQQKVSLVTPIFEWANQTKHDWYALEEVCDAVTQFYCSEAGLPDSITQEMIDTCNSLTSHFYGGMFKDHSLFFAPTWREVRRVMDEALGGITQTKVSIFGAHDLTLIGLLATLKNGYDEMPPRYGSHASIEVYLKDDEHYIRVVYNGKEVNLFNTGQYLMKLHEFRAIIDPDTLGCPELP